MIEQMVDIENLEVKIGKRLERYQQRYGIAHADVAWILLRIGTSYYFKDICSRALEGNGHFGGNGHS